MLFRGLGVCAMLTEIELDAAVEAGIIGEDQAIALRNFQAERVQAPAATLEKFQLFGGLADLMQAAGLALMFFAVFVILQSLRQEGPFIVVPLFPPLLYAIGSRLVTPSNPATTTVIAVAFLVSSLFSILCFLAAAGVRFRIDDPYTPALILIPPTLAGTVLFWKRFRFPPTFAIALTMAAIVTTMVCDSLARHEPETYDYLVLNLILLVPAVVTLISAIWWDLTDVRRETYRSQVAFWLHCLSGSLIARCAFAIVLGEPPVSESFFFSGLGLHDLPAVLAIILVAAVISLLLDRRSLLVGAILPTILLFVEVGNESVGLALGLVFAGGSLFGFTRAWRPARAALIQLLPRKIAAQLPRTNVTQPGQRPTRRHLALQPRKIA